MRAGLWKLITIFPVLGKFLWNSLAVSSQVSSHFLHMTSALLWPAPRGLAGFCDLLFSHKTLLLSFCSILTGRPWRDSSHNLILPCWDNQTYLWKQSSDYCWGYFTCLWLSCYPICSLNTDPQYKNKAQGIPDCSRHSQTYASLHLNSRDDRFGESHSLMSLS